MRPYWSFRVSNTGDILRIFASVLVGVAISLLCEAWHRAWRRMKPASNGWSGRCSSCGSSRRACRRPSSTAVAISPTCGSASPTPTRSGKPVEQIVGRSIVEIAGREAFEQLRPYYDRVLAGETVHYEEVVEIRGIGPRWVNAVYQPTFGPSDVPNGWVAVLLDITERRKMDEALRRSEERFARFMQFLPGLAWIKDLQGRYVFANDAALAAFNQPRDALYGKQDTEIFPAAAARQFAENDRKALATQTGVQAIETLQHRDGRVHHSLVNKFPIPGADGRPAFVGGIAIDITDQLHAEQVRAESEERFRQMAESINEVFWMADPDVTQMLYVSPAYERVWGKTCRSLYERPLSFLDPIHPEDRERIRQVALERHIRGESSDEEYRLVMADGSIRWVRDRGFPIKDDSGRVFRKAGIAEDVTEKKHAEEVLESKPTAARTSSWRPSATNCETRWPRSATPSN